MHHRNGENNRQYYLRPGRPRRFAKRDQKLEWAMLLLVAFMVVLHELTKIIFILVPLADLFRIILNKGLLNQIMETWEMWLLIHKDFSNVRTYPT